MKFEDNPHVEFELQLGVETQFCGPIDQNA